MLHDWEIPEAAHSKDTATREAVQRQALQQIETQLMPLLPGFAASPPRNAAKTEPGAELATGVLQMVKLQSHGQSHKDVL